MSGHVRRSHGQSCGIGNITVGRLLQGRFVRVTANEVVQNLGMGGTGTGKMLSKACIDIDSFR